MRYADSGLPQDSASLQQAFNIFRAVERRQNTDEAPLRVEQDRHGALGTARMLLKADNPAATELACVALVFLPASGMDWESKAARPLRDRIRHDLGDRIGATAESLAEFNASWRRAPDRTAMIKNAPTAAKIFLLAATAANVLTIPDFAAGRATLGMPEANLPYCTDLLAKGQKTLDLLRGTDKALESWLEKSLCSGRMVVQEMAAEQDANEPDRLAGSVAKAPRYLM